MRRVAFSATGIRCHRNESSQRYGPKTVFAGLSDMTDPNEKIHVSAQDARAGATPHVTRYILAISLILVILAFVFLFME